MEVKITKANFKSEVLESNIPVLVDFYADWCGPCRMIAPILSEIAKEYAGKVKVVKINVDEESELAINFGIDSIPAILLFKNGELSGRKIGYCTKDELLKLL